MSKTTVGPWEVNTCQTLPGKFFIDQMELKDTPNIAEIDGGANGLGNEVNRANAQLIAAAPEMLETLEEAANFIATECSHDGNHSGLCGSHEPKCLAQGIFQVIEKAKGVK